MSYNFCNKCGEVMDIVGADEEGQDMYACPLCDPQILKKIKDIDFYKAYFKVMEGKS